MSPVRYYAFSATLGRKRVPGNVTEAEAVAWAKAHGAANVTREDGPVSKPTSYRIVWEHHRRRKATVTVWDANGTEYTVEATALRPAKEGS